jgi:hypothetical protein
MGDMRTQVLPAWSLRYGGYNVTGYYQVEEVVQGSPSEYGGYEDTGYYQLEEVAEGYQPEILRILRHRVMTS